MLRQSKRRKRLIVNRATKCFRLLPAKNDGGRLLNIGGNAPVTGGAKRCVNASIKVMLAIINNHVVEKLAVISRSKPPGSRSKRIDQKTKALYKGSELTGRTRLRQMARGGENQAKSKTGPRAKPISATHSNAGCCGASNSPAKRNNCAIRLRRATVQLYQALPRQGWY